MNRPDYVELVSPVAPDPQVTEEQGARRPFALSGARVSIVDNSKSNAKEVLEALRRRLVDSHGTRPGITVRKPVSGPIEDRSLAALRDQSDLVLIGSAD
jgi:hypothetical protein